MRIMQLVDSLEMGGTEKIAVMIANALSFKPGMESFLYSSRGGGLLEKELDPKVKFIKGNKRSFFDFRSFFDLRRFVIDNRIEILHAHSSSVVWASLVKLFKPGKIKLVWHIHHGAIDSVKLHIKFLLLLAGRAVDYTIVVNKRLLKVVMDTFNIDPGKIKYIANFSVLDINNSAPFEWACGGKTKIVMVANIRPEKDFENLLEIILELKKFTDNFIIFNIGMDPGDEYSQRIKNQALDKNISPYIKFLGQRTDIASILAPADIAILTSYSEGLPLSLIEYGFLRLPVVCTAVGECPEVLLNGEAGILVPAKNPQIFAGKLYELILNKEQRLKLSSALFENVNKNYSKSSFMENLLSVYDSA